MTFTKFLFFSMLSAVSISAVAETAFDAATTNATATSPAAATTAPVLPTNAAGTPDISGKYQCQGYDPYGKSNYTNPVSISKNGDTYSIQWLSSKGYPLLLGTGLFNKAINNAVSVVFWDPKKADYFGTIIYEAKSDGSLVGYWTIQGENLIGTENCTKSAK